MANKLQEQLYKELTNKVIASIESGNFGQWVSKFSQNGLPKNPISNKRYQGGNILSLTFEALSKGYDSNLWMTFKQINEAGGSVLKGQKSTSVWFWQITTSLDKEGNEKKVPLFKVYYVFNLDQTEGLDKIKLKHQEAKEHLDINRIDEVETFLTSIDHKKETYNGIPCYIPSLDLIRMPKAERVIDGNIEEYYSTYFHELAHWTGHKDRLTRKQLGRYSDKASYAYEELIAELSSMFLCAEFGFNSSLQHTEYLGSWLSVLKNDTSFIVNASISAEKAVTYLKEQSASKKEIKKVA